MPLRLALGIRGTVAGRRLGALEGGGGVPPPLPMHSSPRPITMRSTGLDAGPYQQAVRNVYVALLCPDPQRRERVHVPRVDRGVMVQQRLHAVQLPPGRRAVQRRGAVERARPSVGAVPEQHPQRGQVPALDGIVRGGVPAVGVADGVDVRLGAVPVGRCVGHDLLGHVCKAVARSPQQPLGPDTEPDEQMTTKWQ